MESGVTGIITPIDLSDVLFQTVLNYILQIEINEIDSITITCVQEVSCSLKLGELTGLYLIAQTGRTLQQGLPSVFIDNQSSNLWGNGFFGWRL